MLTVDSPELDINYTGFSEGKIRFIKETCVVLQHFSFPSESDSCVHIDGGAFGKPGYTYSVSNAKSGLHAQVMKENKTLFGVHAWADEKKYVVYHTGCGGNPGAPDGDAVDNFY